MKKQLLFAAILSSSLVNAQSLTDLNEPIIGESTLMYSCDSTDNMSTITGPTAVWNYSQLVGLNGLTQLMELIDPATTANAADFPTSTKALRVENSITNYFNSSSTERVSQGFVYEEPSLGTVLATYDVDNEIIVQYPFAYGDYFSDVFSGMLAFEFNGIPQNPPCNGNSFSIIDGQGTLLLPNLTVLNNVIRYKIIDTVFTQVNLIGPMDIEFVRNQYEYYDFTISNLPVFIHTTIVIQQVGSTTPMLSQTIVVSSVEPEFQLGLNANEETSFTVYPNPSEGTINFKGDFSADASAKILDNSGRVIATIESLQNGQSSDLSNLNKGMYIVVVQNNGTQTSNTIVLR